MARLPYDIYAKTQPKIKQVPSLGVTERAFISQTEIHLQEVIRELKRISLANGFGKLISVRSNTITTTASLLKEHLAQDDRLIKIYNNDTVGGNTLLIDVVSDVPSGFPIEAGEFLPLIVVNNDRIYARASAGSIDVRVMEVSIYPPL